MQNHSGNMIPEITKEEHDGVNNAKRVNIVAGTITAASTVFIGTPTLYAVVNTAAAGQASVVLDSSPNFIGLTTSVLASAPTLFAVVNTGAAGQASVVIDGPVAIKGNVTIDSGLISIIGNMTLDSGSRVGLLGNVTLSDSKGYIGLTTTTNAASPAFIGIVTVTNKDRTITGNVTLDAGSKTQIIGNLTLSDPKGFIGLVTASLGASPAFIGIVTIANTNIRSIAGNLTLSDSKGFIGLSTTVTGAGDRFIGLVTAWARNAGTTKTLIPKNISFAQGSVATIAVPSNTFYITKLLLNSNATVRLNIKSGATYLTGNVSLGININPGGGWVEIGSPDAPVYNGLAAAAAIVIEKFDQGFVSQIGGHLMYFDE